MKPFELIYKAGPFGDETSLYEIKIDKPITIEEFIDCILEDHYDEWGYIDFGTNRIEYRDGQIRSGYLPIKQIVSGGTANGGWSRMDYKLK